MYHEIETKKRMGSGKKEDRVDYYLTMAAAAGSNPTDEAAAPAPPLLQPPSSLPPRDPVACAAEHLVVGGGGNGLLGWRESSRGGGKGRAEEEAAGRETRNLSRCSAVSRACSLFRLGNPERSEAGRDRCSSFLRPTPSHSFLRKPRTRPDRVGFFHTRLRRVGRLLMLGTRVFSKWTRSPTDAACH